MDTSHRSAESLSVGLRDGGFRPRITIVYSPQFTLTKVNYIHYNPVEAGLVQYPEQYLFSSAMDYAGTEGPVKVSLLNLHNLYYI